MSMNNYLMRDCPCTDDCPRRKPGCNCEERIAWKEKYNGRKDTIYKQRNTKSMIDSVILSGKTRRKK